MSNSPADVGYRPEHRARPQPKAPTMAGVCCWCCDAPQCCVCHEPIKRGQPFWHIEGVAEGGRQHAHKPCAKEHMQ